MMANDLKRIAKVFKSILFNLGLVMIKTGRAPERDWLKVQKESPQYS